MRPQEIWFDTDLGSDVDDALALTFLAVLHLADQTHAVGVSTTYGPVIERAQAAATLLEKLNAHSIPIYVGDGQPSSNVERLWSTGKEADGATFDQPLPELSAVPRFEQDFILVMTGPCTNYLKLENIAGFKEHCQKIVVMGGSFKEHEQAPLIENNFEGDPNAILRIIDQNEIPVVLVPVDFTLRFPFSVEAQELISESNQPALILLDRWLQNWLEFTKLFPKDSPFRETIYLHDPLAMAYATWPELFTTQEKSIKILESGELVVDEAGGKKIAVVTEMTSEVKSLIENTITGLHYPG